MFKYKMQMEIFMRTLRVFFFGFTLIAGFHGYAKKGFDLKKSEYACSQDDLVACKELGDYHYKKKDWDPAATFLYKACTEENNKTCFKASEAQAKTGNKLSTGVFLEVGCNFKEPKCCEFSKDIDSFMAMHEKDQKAWALLEEKRQEIQEKKLQAEKKKQEEKEAKERLALDQKESEFSKQCERGRAKSCLELAKILFIRDRKEDSMASFEKACELRQAEGCRYAGVMLIQNGSERYGERLLNEGCSLRDRESCRLLDGLAQDRETALKAQIQAIENRRRQQEQAYLEAQEQARKQQATENLIRAAQGFSNHLNGPQPQPKRRTTCTTRERTWIGGSAYETECED